MTIKEIADIAGVSTATVSRVMNNTDGHVSAETRQRIKQIIAKEEYRPSRIARSLRENKTRTIGVLCEDITAFQTPTIINGINQFLEQKQYQVILHDSRLIQKTNGNFSKIVQYKKDLQDAADLFKASKVDGMIYVALMDHDISDIVPDTDLEMVGVYCYADHANTVCVTYDNQRIVKEIVNRFVQNKKKKIGIITGDMTVKPSKLRFESYKEALAENGITFNKTYVLEGGGWEYDFGVVAARQYLAMTEEKRPDAILAMNDFLALGFIETVEQAGIQIPWDVEIIGFDNREACRFSRPRLSTIDLPLKEMGYAAAELVYNKLNNIKHGSQTENENITFACRIITKESCT